MIDALAMNNEPQSRVPSSSSRSQFPWEEPWREPGEPLVTTAPLTGDVLPTHAVGNFERIFPFNQETLYAAQNIAEVVQSAAATAKQLRRLAQDASAPADVSLSPPDQDALITTSETSKANEVDNNGREIVFTTNSKYYDHESVLLEDDQLMAILKRNEKQIVDQTMATYNQPIPPLPANHWTLSPLWTSTWAPFNQHWGNSNPKRWDRMLASVDPLRKTRRTCSFTYGLG